MCTKAQMSMIKTWFWSKIAPEAKLERKES